MQAVPQLNRGWNNGDVGDGWHGWSAAGQGYKVFRGDGEEEEWGCLLCEGAAQVPGTLKSLGESVWVRSRGEAVLVAWRCLHQAQEGAIATPRKTSRGIG